MSFTRRVRTIYRKELIDILRDRRTLIAMIVVPIVLYPLLMLGSIQAVSYQADQLQQDQVVLGVISEVQKEMLVTLIRHDAAGLQREQPEDGAPEPINGPEPRLYDSADQLQRGIRDREIHAGVVFGADQLVDDHGAQNKIEIFADKEEVRSAMTSRRLELMLERIKDRKEQSRLADRGLPANFVRPFAITFIDLSSPPSILGQALPLILVLMTITGAIYPAIDLTAGERERNTLESVMVCPVPVIDLIVGKFLVVTTIAIMGAALNLASVSATVYFGGFQKVISQTGGKMPIGTMLIVLLCLVPFTVLVSAIMIAVCSFARTFKEAQNYVTPVILAVLIPGGVAALPATRLEGIMLVMPVGNMVLLSRELLLGADVPLAKIAMVLLATALYASAAVAIAANLFGQESVLFTDVGPLRTALSRRFVKPRDTASLPMALLTTALLFPAWFFMQATLSSATSAAGVWQIYGTAITMPLFFVAIPIAILFWWKVRLGPAMRLRRPSARFLLAALLIGGAAWVPLHELNVMQQAILPIPAAMLADLKRLEETIRALPPLEGILALAVVPALCEELLFRGMLFGGLLTKASPRAAIIFSAVIFGVFHFVAFRFVPTVAMGLVLAWLCWRSRSIFAPMLVHALHNGLLVSATWWDWQSPLGIDKVDAQAHLPPMVLVVGGTLFAVGLLLVGRDNSDAGAEVLRVGPLADADGARA